MIHFLIEDMALFSVVSHSELMPPGITLGFALQPVISSCGTEYYAEMLARPFENGRPVHTDVFIKGIEDKGKEATLAFDSLVLRQARWFLDTHPNRHIGVNVSGLTIDNPEWLKRVADILTKPDYARRVVMELTETRKMEDTNQARSSVAELKSFGVRVALDDFGSPDTTHHLNVGSVKNLLPDFVKLDRALQDGVTASPEKQSYIRYLFRRLSDELGAKIIVEGVQDEKTMAWFGKTKPDVLLQSHFLIRPSAIPGRRIPIALTTSAA